MMKDEISYTGKVYPQYFKTPHWRKLKDQLIYSNPKAKCWVCEKTNSLLIHHVQYANLFREKIGRDVYILCFDCHEQVHFYGFLFFFTRKTKLTKRRLKTRMALMKAEWRIRKKRFGSAILAILQYIIFAMS